MASATTGGLLPALFPELSLENTPRARDRVLGFYKSFQSEMGDLMKMLLDDSKDLELSGYKIPADQKNGAAASYLINNWLDEQNFVFSQLLDAYKFEQSLENKLNQMAFS